MQENRPYRIMISGGGTGGHIYPAISIAQALESALSEVEILFVGAQGKMEMTKVPEAGYEIVGLWISGLQRKLTLSNLLFPIKLINSIVKSFRLLKSFKPDAVVGVGGYASGPLLYAAASKKIPTLIQEQNSYAGLTNKWLAKKVDKICVAYEGLDKYFPAEKLVITGNPVRAAIGQLDSRDQAATNFDLDATKKTMLIVGGSLGARTINESIEKGLAEIRARDVQIIWQTGSYYHESIVSRTCDQNLTGIKILDFITDMRQAYSACDLVISRAGALAIAELMLTGKATLLVPSPNVAEDHQSMNAKALVEKDAAVMVRDDDASEVLIKEAMDLLADDEKLRKLETNISELARPDAAKEIANEVIKLIA